MPSRALPIALIAALLLATPLAAQTPGGEPERVAALIEQLGSVKYVERREAQRALAEIGLAAFDQLYEATTHDDAEVAAASARLLSGMTLRWAQPGDSAAVRAVLDLYGRLDEQDRVEAVRRLARLPDGAGLPALCRIARFDVSRTVAARAAAEAMADDSLAVPREKRETIAASLDELDELYGGSRRDPPMWLRWCVDEVTDPGEAATRWANEVARLRAIVKRNDSAVEPQVMEQLAWWLLRAQLAAGRERQAAATAAGLIEAAPSRDYAVTKRALEWLLESDANDAVDRLLAREDDRLSSKRGLYLAADARFRQGRKEEAEQLAQEAFEAAAQPGDSIVQNGEVVLVARALMGNLLREGGHTEWAVREYRRAFEEAPPLSADAAYAVWQLSDVLQDDARYEPAADALRQFNNAVNADEASRKTFLRNAERRQRLPLQPPHVLLAREAYYRALARRAQGDVAGEHEALRAAVEHDETDADIVIAIYHATDADDQLRADALKLVRSLADAIDEQVDEDPSDPLPYNQWAWLISNTEGDYEKALRYSQRSLRLRPGDAGYLDTLGRCYYALGEYEKAVETQRDAVERQPHYRVMRRQLELFERALAEQNAGDAPAPAPNVQDQ